jgi:hypothetical protein
MTSTQVTAATSELLARLGRLEERINDIFLAVEKLAVRDAEFDASLRSISEHFSLALAAQAEDFRKSLMELTANPAAQGVHKSSRMAVISRLQSLMACGRSMLFGRPY